MRVLITGHCGYLGAVLAGYLQRRHYDVVGVDCGWYRGCDFGRVREEAPSFDTDVRDLEFTDLLSFDAVIHLAGLPEDPDQHLDHHLTSEIDVSATLRLAECCKKAQVERFLYASSCAVYGSSDARLIDEESPPAPITAYARSKLRCEQGLAKLADESFTPVFLRLGTVYGVSPRLRLDTVVNEFTASALTQGRIDARTAGQAWRPLIHVEDVARGVAAVLNAPKEEIHVQILNVLKTSDNHRIIDVADAICQIIPDATYTMNRDIPDARSYRVCGEKLARICPNLSFRWSLERGIRQLREALEHSGLTPGELHSTRYRRVAWLCQSIESGQLTAKLRPVTSSPGLQIASGDW